MGLGNVDYGDDGAGVHLAGELAQAGVPGVVIAGTTPERHLGRVADGKFGHLLFLDAVDFGGEPGSVVFLNSREMAARFPQVSTHKISLGLLSQWTEADGATRAWLLGVQPSSLQPSGALTEKVQTTLDVLKELLVGLAFDGSRKPGASEALGGQV
jgi:hydrogenase 3 maturation protease